MRIIKNIVSVSVCVFLFFLNPPLYAERIRVLIKDKLDVNSETSAGVPSGVSVLLSYNDSALITLPEDTRFFRGLELEVTVPQTLLPHSGSMAFALYSNLNPVPDLGGADVECTQILYVPISNKIQTVYQIPLRSGHGLRETPYFTLFKTPVLPENFPLLFRLTPNMKGWSKEIEFMRFQLNIKPIFSDEGALTINVRRPEFLPNGSYTVLVDDRIIEKPGEVTMIKEGEHTLTLISSDYRTENRRFMIERGSRLNLSVTLHDLTPLIIFEAPELAKIFIDNTPAARTDTPLAVEPGPHTIRIQVSDYSIVKTVSIEKGKTYRIAFIVDMQITEE
jgi:hypothetical protein